MRLALEAREARELLGAAALEHRRLRGRRREPAEPHALARDAVRLRRGRARRVGVGLGAARGRLGRALALLERARELAHARAAVVGRAARQRGRARARGLDGGVELLHERRAANAAEGGGSNRRRERRRARRARARARALSLAP